MKKIPIAIIDTSVVKNHESLVGTSIHTIKDDNITHDYKTIDGHGTAVCSIIRRYCPDCDIYVFPVFRNDDGSTEIDDVINALRYILEKCYDIKIINMSCGIIDLSIDQKMLLYDLCDKLTTRGVIIIAGYDNNGNMCYPACFSNVIGVDISRDINKHGTFNYVENSPINIRGCFRPQRVAWSNPQYMYCAGSSFVVPFISGLLAAQMNKEKIENTKKALEVLKKMACSNYVAPSYHIVSDSCNMNSAILFPYNKEIETIIRLEDYLQVKIHGVYDIKYHKRNIPSNRSVIKNINEIDWSEDFDTVVIGHCDQINSIVGTAWLQEVINKAITYNKKIYAFNQLDGQKFADQEQIYMPHISYRNVPYNQYGKMWRINTPIIGVFGTKSQQGKFTAQIILINQLRQIGYNVGFLSTEPSGRLFGADACFPYGYNSMVDVKDNDFVLALNAMMHFVDEKGYDVIITGGQSGTLPYEPTHVSRLLINQHLFLMGCQPDSIILCVSIDDDIEYIERTIQYIRAITEGEITAIFVAPFVNEMFMTSIMRRRKIDLTTEYDNFRKAIECFGIPIYTNTKEDMIQAIDNVLNPFI